MPYEWTKEKLRKRTKAEIKEVRKNAQNRSDVVRLCDDVLADLAAEQRVGKRSIAQFHFVCRDGENKYEEGEFTVTGRWVVAEDHARVAAARGAVVALHQEKREASYWQGRIVDWRPVISEADKTVHRVEFICEPIDTPSEWHGKGTGEKGYRWSDGTVTAELT